MVKKIIFTFAFVALFALSLQQVENNVVFTVYADTFQNSNVTKVNESLEKYGCDNSTNIYFIVHGWLENSQSEWVTPLIQNFLNFGGGCVVFMDYYFYSKLNYYYLVTYYEQLRDVLYRKLVNTGNFSRVFMFGFSFGARLCQGAGYSVTLANGGVPQIKDMHLCEPAGPYFDGYPTRVNPLLSAKNTQCINTSYDKGTVYYDCTQNFRMGYCGWSQVASGPYPKGSHGLCPYFYNLAFTYNYTDNNYYGCSATRPLNKTLVKDAVMGFRNTVFFNGEMFIMTSYCPPYLFQNNVIYNIIPGSYYQCANITN